MFICQEATSELSLTSLLHSARTLSKNKVFHSLTSLWVFVLSRTSLRGEPLLLYTHLSNPLTPSIGSSIDHLPLRSVLFIGVLSSCRRHPNSLSFLGYHRPHSLVPFVVTTFTIVPPLSLGALHSGHWVEIPKPTIESHSPLGYPLKLVSS